MLHPKMTRFFKVFFVAEGADENTTSVLEVLNEQTVAVHLPKRVTPAFLQSVNGHALLPPTGKKRGHFTGIHTTGELVVTVESDTANSVSTAVDLLVKTANTNNMHIMVVHMNGNNEPLEAFLFTGAALHTVEYSNLDYRTHGTVYDTNVPSHFAGGSTSAPSQNISVNVIDSEHTALVTQKLAFKPQFTQYFKSASQTQLALDDLLGDI